MIEDAMNIIRKGGAVVATALSTMADNQPTLG
jgi:S-(hydroxymethyl)glutathione dehydrogenase/alcohol dehydrogenase